MMLPRERKGKAVPPYSHHEDGGGGCLSLNIHSHREGYRFSACLRGFKPPPPHLSYSFIANRHIIKYSGVPAILLLLFHLALIIKSSLAEGMSFRYLPSWRRAPGWEVFTSFVEMTAHIFSTHQNYASQRDWRWPTLKVTVSWLGC